MLTLWGIHLFIFVHIIIDLLRTELGVGHNSKKSRAIQIEQLFLALFISEYSYLFVCIIVLSTYANVYLLSQTDTLLYLNKYT